MLKHGAPERAAECLGKYDASARGTARTWSVICFRPLLYSIWQMEAVSIVRAG